MRNLKSEEHLIKFHEVHETKKAIIMVLAQQSNGKLYLQFKPQIQSALMSCIVDQVGTQSGSKTNKEAQSKSEESAKYRKTFD